MVDWDKAQNDLAEEEASAAAREVRVEPWLGADQAQHAANVEMLLTSVLIQQSRTYDVMLALLLETNPESAKELRKMHENGELWAPPPSFALDEDEN